MSTATASPNITHLPHTAHPVPLREQAFTLHCEGLRSPAIAQELGVSERTIRAWIAAALDDLKDDLQLSRRQQLLLAIERQHQLTAVAWRAFEHEATARDALLDATLETLHTPAEATARPSHLHLPASTPATRYLSLILQANKEANRLLGLHTLARLQLLSSDSAVAPADSDIPAESATVTPSSDIPAESATASHSPLLARRGAGGEDPSPAKSATLTAAIADIPAESATATTPSLSVSSVPAVVQSRIPAKSATATASPNPMRRPGRLPAKTPLPWMM